MKSGWGAVLSIVALAVVLTYIQVWIIKWAVSLFYPISMWQAFGASVLLTMISSTFKGIKK